MRLLRALVGIDAPPEARFFLVVGGFAFVVDVVYWFASYEDAGTLLLGGFALAALLMGTRLAATAPSPRRAGHAGSETVLPDHPGSGGVPTSGRAEDPQRPFLDESGRLPTPTFAPFALAMGVAIAATSLVFGPAPLLVAAIPAAWGAFRWLAGASDELSAMVAGEAGRDAEGGVSDRLQGVEGRTNGGAAVESPGGEPAPSPSAPVRDRA